MNVAGPAGPPRTLLRGRGALGRLPTLVGRHGSARVLLVTGRRSFVTSGAARALDPLDRSTEVLHWDGVAPNPDVRDIDAALAAACEHRPDTVIGIGGGSVLDTAKVVAGLLGAGVNAGSTSSVVGTGKPLDTRTVRLMLVPTTAGSGAEATPFATVYDGPTKWSVTGEALRADAIVLDPDLVRSTHGSRRAAPAFDAIAQAIESMWAVGATAASRRDARWALATMMPVVRDFVAGGDGPPAARSARAMLVGSHLAGRAIAVSRTTAAHALSYALTTDLGLPHGQAVGVTLPTLLRAHATASERDLDIDPAVHRAAMAEILHALGSPDGASAASHLERLLADIGLLPLDPGVSARLMESAAELAERANPERLGNDSLRHDAELLEAALRAGAVAGR